MTLSTPFDYDTALLESNGFAIVPDVINRETVRALIEAVEQADKAIGLRQRKNDTYAIRNLLVNVPAMKNFAESAPIREIVRRVLGDAGFAVRGLLFDKTPTANWKVAWHQDLTIAVKERRNFPGYGPWSNKAGIPHVQPPVSILENMLTLRLHLDDCTKSNGPLQVLPKSHRTGKLSPTEIQDWRVRVPAVDCLIEQGGLLLMRPLLLHASSPAQQPQHRRVIHLEFATGKLAGGLEWHN